MLFEKAKSVTDRYSFLEFLELLRMDYMDASETWENQSIDLFIEAVKSWVEDYNGNDVNLDNPDWLSVAAMFYMGKLYE